MLEIHILPAVHLCRPKKNVRMCSNYGISIYFTGDVILLIRKDHVQFLIKLMFPVLQGAQHYSCLQHLKKLHALPLSLYVLPTVSLNELLCFPTQLGASGMLFQRAGREGVERFVLPLSVLTGKLFHSSDVLKHFNHCASDPDTSSGSSAQFLLRETHKAAIVTNSASNGSSGN